jgi:REP element-mobilizing transposase RayT
LESFDYTSTNAYFVTFCVQQGRCLFWERQRREWEHTLSETERIVNDVIQSINDLTGAHIDQYVVMPNHVHMIVFWFFTESCGIDRNEVDKRSKEDF